VTDPGRGAPAKPVKGTRRVKNAGGAKCPICGKATSRDYRPFCSKHCADVDLGRWLGGRYVVPGPPVSDDAAKETED
jgi:endogenous inhibitor of DNA gyrase (YacG/DUF329 family)